MKKQNNYKATPLSLTRKMVIESVRANKKNAIHCMAEIDISKPRQMRKKHFEKTGVKISTTAYIVRCFAETFKEFPEMNSFIKRNKLVILNDVTVSVLIEREIDGVKVPEPVGIQKAQTKTVKEIHSEIREAQNKEGNSLGDLSGMTWVRFIPKFLIRTFIRIADSNIKLAQRYGKVSVTAVGMFSESKAWFIPHGTATVLLTVGTINTKFEMNAEGQVEEKEILHITASFDHEIIDGSPAARFMSSFGRILQSGDLLLKE